MTKMIKYVNGTDYTEVFPKTVLLKKIFVISLKFNKPTTKYCPKINKE